LTPAASDWRPHVLVATEIGALYMARPEKGEPKEKRLSAAK
jgi:hypothetical protein